MVFRKYGKKALSLILTAAMLSAAAYPAAAEELSDGSMAGITDESQAYEESYDGSYKEEASFDNAEVFSGETDPADEEDWGGIPAAAAETPDNYSGGIEEGEEVSEQELQDAEEEEEDLADGEDPADTDGYAFPMTQFGYAPIGGFGKSAQLFELQDTEKEVSLELVVGETRYSTVISPAEVLAFMQNN